MGAAFVRERKMTLKAGGEISLADLLGPGSHGTTFGGTPLACAAAEAVLQAIEEDDLMGNAARLGEHARRGIESMKSELIRETRGVGLMIGIEFIPDYKARAGITEGDDRTPAAIILARLQKAGLLAIPSGTHAIRWLPPLNVTREEIDEAVSILHGVLSEPETA